jgi:hypothetical protein
VRGFRGLLAASLVLAVAGGAVAGEQVIRVEVVGAVPAGDLAPAGVPIRQAALEEALTEAVARVARDLVSAGPAPKGGPTTQPPSDAEDWLTLLGGSADDYALGYRVLEDRGERPALLLNDPKVKTEYEVLVEVHVDADRVARRLRAVGLLAAAPPSGAGHQLILVLEPLPSWGALMAIQSQLEATSGVHATPQRFSAGQAALRLDAPGDPGALVDRLVAAPPPGLTLSPEAGTGGERRLRVVEAPPGRGATPTPGPGAD